MAEAEDVIVDAARHATAYAQDLLRRRRRADAPAPITLLDVAPRLDLLLTALHPQPWQLRVAQPPAPVTALTRLFRAQERPWRSLAVPSSDGAAIWLPRQLDGIAAPDALMIYRTMALQQAQRAATRRPEAMQGLVGTLQREIFLVLEAEAADAALERALPGLRAALRQLRAQALRQRPPLERFAVQRRPLERWLRERLAKDHREVALVGPDERVGMAATLSNGWPDDGSREPLFKDWWTGGWPPTEGGSGNHRGASPDAAGAADDDERPVRSARLARSPEVRQAADDEDEGQPGPTMVQTAQPHESAEDPMGLQRPTDRDTDDAAEAHAESVSDLPHARLVQSAQRAHEVLLSDDAPVTAARPHASLAANPSAGIRYPEWDWRAQAYRDPGTTVWESTASPGSAEWVERTLAAQGSMLGAIRRRFEMLRAQRTTLHRQEDGDDIDIEACIEARADLRGGASMSQRLYRSTRLARRDSAVVVLVDASGSTDAWIGGQRRIIDVEREALLALSIALDSSGDPHAILAFSGNGPQQVVVRSVKRFDQRHDDATALRIAGLEPERYTRAGAALRHASRLLAGQPARHRLLLLLSDGKPNDQDDYEGRYGVEDMRQAVREARHAGQSPFCLTVDRHAAAYMPRIFGPHHYALLQRPELLPTVLLEWMKRLLAR
ncbi:MAG: VWA domain-containing protein [Burkholderiaceae bacterium]